MSIIGSDPGSVTVRTGVKRSKGQGQIESKYMYLVQPDVGGQHLVFLILEKKPKYFDITKSDYINNHLLNRLCCRNKVKNLHSQQEVMLGHLFSV